MQGRTVLQGKGILCPREQQTTNQPFEIEKNIVLRSSAKDPLPLRSPWYATPELADHS